MAFFVFFFYTFFSLDVCFTSMVGIKAGIGKSKEIKYYRPFLLFVGSARLNEDPGKTFCLPECEPMTQTPARFRRAKSLVLDDAGNI